MYVSGLGMAILALSAALILSQMEKLNDSQNFLFFNNTKSFENLDDCEGCDHNNLKEIALLVCILGYVCFSSIGMVVIPWTLLSELFPIEVCDKISSDKIYDHHYNFSLSFCSFIFRSRENLVDYLLPLHTCSCFLL